MGSSEDFIVNIWKSITLLTDRRLMLTNDDIIRIYDLYDTCLIANLHDELPSYIEDSKLIGNKILFIII